MQIMLAKEKSALEYQHKRDEAVDLQMEEAWQVFKTTNADFKKEIAQITAEKKVFKKRWILEKNKAYMMVKLHRNELMNSRMIAKKKILLTQKLMHRHMQALKEVQIENKKLKNVLIPSLRFKTGKLFDEIIRLKRKMNKLDHDKAAFEGMQMTSAVLKGSYKQNEWLKSEVIPKLKAQNDAQAAELKRLERRIADMELERATFQVSKEAEHEKEMLEQQYIPALETRTRKQAKKLAELNKHILNLKFDNVMKQCPEGSEGAQSDENMQIESLASLRALAEKQADKLTRSNRMIMKLELRKASLKVDLNVAERQVKALKGVITAVARITKPPNKPLPLIEALRSANDPAVTAEVLEAELDLAQDENKNLKAALTEKCGKIMEELKALREELEDSRTEINGMKEDFTAPAQEYKDLCFKLLGYTIEKIGDGKYKLSNMYAKLPEEYFTFVVRDDHVELEQNEYTAAQASLIEMYLQRHNSIPLFLSALTCQLFMNIIMEEHASRTTET